VLRESQRKNGIARGDPALEEARTAPALRSRSLSFRKLWISVESSRQFVSVEARRHFKRPAKPDRGRPSSPWSVERLPVAFFCARGDAAHAAHDQLKSSFAPGEVKARPFAGAVGQEVLGKDDVPQSDADELIGVSARRF
jgi:hypothetical protein